MESLYKSTNNSFSELFERKYKSKKEYLSNEVHSKKEILKSHIYLIYDIFFEHFVEMIPFEVLTEQIKSEKILLAKQIDLYLKKVLNNPYAKIGFAIMQQHNEHYLKELESYEVPLVQSIYAQENKELIERICDSDNRMLLLDTISSQSIKSCLSSYGFDILVKDKNIEKVRVSDTDFDRYFNRIDWARKHSTMHGKNTDRNEYTKLFLENDVIYENMVKDIPFEVTTEQIKSEKINSAKRTILHLERLLQNPVIDNVKTTIAKIHHEYYLKCLELHEVPTAETTNESKALPQPKKEYTKFVDLFKDASDLEKIKDVLKVENHLSEDGCLISKDSFVERTIFDYCKAKSLFVEPKINREIFAKLVTIEFNKKISGRSLENVPKNIDKENDLKKAFELALRAK